MESELKQIFKQLDEGRGYLYKAQIPLALRAAGLIIAECEVKGIQDSQPAQIDFQAYKKCIYSFTNPTEAELTKIFQKPGDKNQISTTEMQKILQGEGEPLSQTEIQEFFEQIEQGGYINYEQLIKSVLN